MNKILILILCFGSTALFCYQFVPVAWDKFSTWRLHGIETNRLKLKGMYLDIDPKKLFLINVFSPIIFGFMGLFLTRSLIGLLIGGGAGLVVPAIVVKNLVFGRKTKFNSQITDGLMILSSCLKGGLSLLQAIEGLVEELPPPISQEFGMILRENKMGISLEESFENLTKRLPSEELNLLTTAILVARETGGDITLLFSRLIETIRAKSKLGDSVRTLSMQGTIQGIVMSFLPIGFSIMVVSFNPNYFDVMLGHPLGRGMMVYAIVSELIGIYMIKTFSKVNI